MTTKVFIKRSSIVALLVFLVTIIIASIGFAETLTGRDYVRLGKLTTLKGKLILDDGEWMLKAGDSVYEIHMGPSEYREAKGFTLMEGETATVKGFLYKSQMAVTVIETGGKSIILRDQSGNPAWSGTTSSQSSGSEN